MGAVKEEILTQDASKDFYQCMHLVNDWKANSNAEWDDFFSDIKVGSIDSNAICYASSQV